MRSIIPAAALTARVATLLLLALAAAASLAEELDPSGDGAPADFAIQLAAAASAGTGAPRSELERAWFDGGVDLGSRAARVRLRALELGVDNLETAARALIAPGAATRDSGTESGRALLAVKLAPDLPIAHMALARAHWNEGEHGDALAAAGAGLAAIPRHLEASFWLVSSLLVMFTAVLVVGSLCFIGLVGASVTSHAAHDLGDLFSSQMPGFARGALLASLLLVPLCLGEGLLGLALGLLALGFAYGSAQHRLALLLAAVLVVLGLYPVTRAAGTALQALDSDPLADAVLAVARGSETSWDVELVEGSAAEDPLAAHALALLARRSGDLEVAHARYAALLEQEPENAIVLANLGNLRFRRGEIESATELYERSRQLQTDVRLLFNLSQTYARSFRMEEFERALASAQRVDAAHVAELSHIADPSFVADLPLPTKIVRARLLESASGEAFAGVVARPLAPGFLGLDWRHTGLGLAAAAALGLVVGGRFGHSSQCSRCGRRICARCDGTVWNSEICDSCHRLFHRPETTDSSLRMARLTELRVRESRRNRVAAFACFAIPGVGGLLARRPDLAFGAVLCASWAIVALLFRDGAVPDPLVVGGAGPLAFVLTGAAALLAYLALVCAGLVLRRRL